MFDLLVYFLLSLGIPLPEPFARPAAERMELVCSKDFWPQDMACRARRSLTLPMLSECAYLPPTWLATQRMHFASHHCQWVRAQVESDTVFTERWRAWWREAELRWQWYDSAVDAQREHFTVWRRRECLGKCRDMLTWEDFYGCTWPDEAPFWRFVDR